MREADVAGWVFVASGCASGIGLHLADELLKRGARVVATDIEIEALRTRAAERGWDRDRVEILPLDVRDPDAWERVLDRAAERFGPVDVLINDAGIIRPAWLTDTTAEDVHRHLDVNAKGVIFGTRAAAIRMKARGRGHIVNLCSLCGVSPTPGLTLYGASKFAIRGFSLGVAQELAPHGVAVTVICPDGVDTPMVRMEMHHEEAAIVFSGSRLLTVQDLSRVLLRRVLTRRPPEVQIPLARGLLCHLASLWPTLAMWIEPWVQAVGERNRIRLLQDASSAAP